MTGPARLSDRAGLCSHGHERPPPDSDAHVLATPAPTTRLAAQAIGKGLVRRGGCEDPR